MNGFRTTKYDPSRRAPDGTYLDSDWTSVSDFLDETADVTEYLSSEDHYIGAIRHALKLTKLDTLNITDLEFHGGHDGIPPSLADESKELIRIVEGIGEVATIEEALSLSRAVLREFAWCKLTGDGGFYVHFGYDYYMYIGDAAGRLEGFDAPGLFVEEFTSPYS